MKNNRNLIKNVVNNTSKATCTNKNHSNIRLDIWFKFFNHVLKIRNTYSLIFSCIRSEIKTLLFNSLAYILIRYTIKFTRLMEHSN